MKEWKKDLVAAMVAWESLKKDLAMAIQRAMEEVRKILLRAFHRLRGLPEFVEYCQRRQREAARRAKYYRRMNFKRQNRRGRT